MVHMVFRKRKRPRLKHDVMLKSARGVKRRRRQQQKRPRSLSDSENRRKRIKYRETSTHSKSVSKPRDTIRH